MAHADCGSSWEAKDLDVTRSGLILPQLCHRPEQRCKARQPEHMTWRCRQAFTTAMCSACLPEHPDQSSGITRT